MLSLAHMHILTQSHASLRDCRENKLAAVSLRMVALTRAEAGEFYAEHKGKPFYDNLIAFMSEGPLVAIEILGTNAIAALRKLIGPTDSARARVEAPGTNTQTHSREGACVTYMHRLVTPSLSLCLSVSLSLALFLSLALSLARCGLHMASDHHSAGSIRARFGTDGTRNAVHGSDSKVTQTCI